MSATSPTSSDQSAAAAGRNFAVIGGGITGLAAAHRLITLNKDAHVTLFEASDRLGGIINTAHEDGWLLELGPDAFITNKPGGVTLCEEIGLTDRLIPTDNTFRRSLVLRNGQPKRVPDGFMLMAPSNLQAIRDTPILSPAGRARLLQEADIPPKSDTADESLADFVRRRFGEEALDRLVQPLVGGIYTADPEKLSLQATLPRFPEMERTHGSVIAATLQENEQKSAQRASSGSGARYGLFTAPEDGVGSLISALVDVLKRSGQVSIRTSTPIETVSQNSDHSWQISLPSGTAERFDGVAMTLPTHKIAELLNGPQLQPLADRLQQIPYASSAIVLTGHRLQDFDHPLDAFGLVIPHKEGRRILATSFTSRKFPGRAPAGHVLLRTFVGGAMQPEQLNFDDDEISMFVNEELQQILGLKAGPLFSRVVRYNNAMPQYHVGHGELVDRIEQLTAEQPGLELAGNAYRGVGIPDSISSGRQAAEQLLATVRS